VSAAPTSPAAPAAPDVPGPRVHEVVTPEGVPLQLEVAMAGDRLGALFIDLLIVVAAVATLSLGLHYAALFVLGDDAVQALVILIVFLVWTFYFPVLELAWQGQTVGKRVLHIRAVDARGGPLTAEAVIARNLARQFEIFLPIVAVASASAGGWLTLAALGWMVVFGFLPLFNKDRQRVGDLVAGTIVIRTPRAVLFDDLTTRTRSALTFSEAQLDVYGVYELQVLEGVLRGAGRQGHWEAVRAVADKIRQKIGWTGPPGDDEAFLQAFYSALRGRLERRLLFGKRRKSKHDRT
jgi:uncharacterized RDD family membrane protein YckC